MPPVKPPQPLRSRTRPPVRLHPPAPRRRPRPQRRQPRRRLPRPAPRLVATPRSPTPSLPGSHRNPRRRNLSHKSLNRRNRRRKNQDRRSPSRRLQSQNQKTLATTSTLTSVPAGRQLDTATGPTTPAKTLSTTGTATRTTTASSVSDDRGHGVSRYRLLQENREGVPSCNCLEGSAGSNRLSVGRRFESCLQVSSCDAERVATPTSERCPPRRRWPMSATTR